MNSNRFHNFRWFFGGIVTAWLGVLLLGGPSGRSPVTDRKVAIASEHTAPAPLPNRAPANEDGKLNIVVFGAHPDDCELAAGGTAAKWAALGHHVKFVSCTNGDIGHWGMSGGPLALRRTAEVKKCATILGVETAVLDIHDGELMVTMENRRTICRLIREWKADLVISHRPNDYHPDHRYTGVLVMDAAYMVTVPFFCPDTPYLTKNPVFLFSEDEFRRPNSFAPDIVVAIDEMVEKKLACVEALRSQFYEGGCNGGPHLVPNPKDAAAVAGRNKQVRDEWAGSFAATANRFRAEIAAFYGREPAAAIQFAEAFEICEYGRRPTDEEIRKLFPFFPTTGVTPR
jgi:N-acetylglucosamine malate deacetylase 1